MPEPFKVINEELGEINENGVIFKLFFNILNSLKRVEANVQHPLQPWL